MLKPAGRNGRPCPGRSGHRTNLHAIHFYSATDTVSDVAAQSAIVLAA
jgi:hypothetical protein